MTARHSPRYLEDLFATLGGVVPAVSDTWDPLSASDVREIERLANGTLPSLYSQLLTTFGAVTFNEYVFFSPDVRFPASYSPLNRGIVRTFLGKQNDQYPQATGISVIHTLRLLKPEIGDKSVPIADTGGGGLLCLQLDEPDYGEIRLWNHDCPEGSDGYHVSKSFEDWLCSLSLM